MSRIFRGWLAILASVVGLVICLRLLWQCWLYCIGEAPNLYLIFVEMMASAFGLEFAPASHDEGIFSMLAAPFVWVAGLILWLIPATFVAASFSLLIRTIQVGRQQAVKESRPGARSFIRAFFSGSDRE